LVEADATEGFPGVAEEVVEIVRTQVTKTCTFAARIGVGHLPDLHFLVGDDHQVDE
jgi:hypothetical protein